MDKITVKGKVFTLRKADDEVSVSCRSCAFDQDTETCESDVTRACLKPGLVWVETNEVANRIVCAANMSPNGDIVLGVRHFDRFMCDQIRAMRGADKIQWRQGFVDKNGVFLTREEAYVVAKEAGQIIRRVGGDEDKLFSENLY